MRLFVAALLCSTQIVCFFCFLVINGVASRLKQDSGVYALQTARSYADTWRRGLDREIPNRPSKSANTTSIGI